MSQTKAALIGLLAILPCVPLWAQEAAAPGGDMAHVMAEAAWDWRPGDLIFRDGINPVDDAMKRALGLQWASVGILRASSGGPRVVFAGQTAGVTEEMLYEHVEGLSPDGYAVYRLRDLAPDYDPEELMWAGPMVRLGLTFAYGAPFDDQLALGDGAFYNAELAYVSALNAGIVAGAPVRLRDLLASPEAVEGDVRALLEGHRYCQYEPTFADCWAWNLRDQAIVTTDSLIESGALERVFPQPQAEGDE